MTKSRRKPAKPAPLNVPSEPIIGPQSTALASGEYEQAAFLDGKAERKRYVRVTPCLLDVLVRAKTITRQQCEAGKCYAADHEIEFGSHTRDSCVLRVGGVTHETEAQADRARRAKWRMNLILNRAGPAAYALLRQVAVFEQKIGLSDRNALRYMALKSVLNVAADVYGVPE